MILYIEFDGIKLRGTECFSYQEARFMLFKILDQCMVKYRRHHNRKIFAPEEMELQTKILEKLKLIYQM